ncbi:MAG TPA: MerR family transcriptional regulator [Beutenbergiaceae bacterium]|nr:MerR family transcriptional regulator [Beutenbergiaceae bacterium]
MRSGQLAAAAGVNLQTLRYYERRGLLPEPDRSLGGHRNYGQDAVTVLRIVKAAQQLGFTLAEIKELLTVGSHRGPRPGLRQRAEEKLNDVETKIAALEVMRTGLLEVLDAGCTDLMECSCQPGCPIPFPDLDTHLDTGSTPY